MKRFVIVVLTLTMVMGIGLGSASAANSLRQGAIGLSFDVNEDYVLSGRFFVTKDIAVLAGFGVGAKGADADGTDIAVSGGARKYLKVDDFAPFVGGTAFYSSTQDGDVKNLRVMGEFGMEYFLHKQFSVEGSVGFGYSSEETKITTTTTVGAVTVTTSTNHKETNIGTQRAGIGFNFYF